MRKSHLLSLVCALLFGAFGGAAAQGNEAKDAREVAAAQLRPVHEFLSRGGDANAVPAHRTLLETATNFNRADLVRALLDRGADPNRCGHHGECALTIAATRDTDILRLLLQAGADVNRIVDNLGYSALSRSASVRPETFTRLRASGGYRGAAPDAVEAVRLLLRAGANPNHVDAFGESPLRTAMRVNNLDIARLLLQAGADVHQHLDDTTSLGEQRGNTILMNTVWWYPYFRDAAAVELLLSYGANPDDRNSLLYDAECDDTTSGKCSWRGYTVLTYAAKNGMAAVVWLLFQHGADPTVPRSDGKLALTLAIEKQHLATAKMVELGARR